jgi:hypothetical protein
MFPSSKKNCGVLERRRAGRETISLLVKESEKCQKQWEREKRPEVKKRKKQKSRDYVQSQYFETNLRLN